MARFLLLLSPALEGRGELSAGELGARTVRFMAWIATFARAGVIRSGARIADGRVIVTRRADAGIQVEHEPATADRIAGYFVVQADELATVIALARACPGADPGAIEILELDPEASVGPADA